MVEEGSVFMAVLSGGILGSVSGKVSGVVAATWKDKNYVREYVIPANPNTAGQQAQRNLFGNIVSVGKLILGQIINPFWDPFQKSMSGINAFIKENIDQATYPVPTVTMKMTQGKLFLDTIVQPTWTGHTVNAKWNIGNGTNGLATDKVNVVVFELAADGHSVVAVAFGAAAARSTGAAGINVLVGTAKTVDSEYKVFVYAVQYLNADPTKAVQLVSYSQGATAEAA